MSFPKLDTVMRKEPKYISGQLGTDQFFNPVEQMSCECRCGVLEQVLEIELEVVVSEEREYISPLKEVTYVNAEEVDVTDGLVGSVAD